MCHFWGHPVQLRVWIRFSGCSGSAAGPWSAARPHVYVSATAHRHAEVFALWPGRIDQPGTIPSPRTLVIAGFQGPRLPRVAGVDDRRAASDRPGRRTPVIRVVQSALRRRRHYRPDRTCGNHGSIWMKTQYHVESRPISPPPSTPPPTL